MTSEREKLLACPFCGRRPVLRKLPIGYQIECNNDEDCTVCVDVRAPTSSQVAERWNTRSTTSFQDGIEAAALKSADELISICEAAARTSRRTGDTFVLSRHRVASMIAGYFAALSPQAGVIQK